MRKVLLLLFGLTFFLVSGQDKENLITKVIVVRHAEKANDRTKNPSLSEEGQNRAKRQINHNQSSFCSSDHTRSVINHLI